MWLFFTRDRTGRRKWCLVRGEQICHPISDCSSILFSPPFLCSLCPLLILAPSPEPMSASHPYSPILALPAPSPLTFCTAQTGESRCHLLLSLSLCFILSFFLSLFLSHSFVSCLPHFPSLCLSLWGGWGLAVVERDEFLIAVGQHRALSLVGISQGGEAKAAEKKKKKKKKNDNFFFIGCIWP